jgi:antitoxin component YwqK of YwqJK toxin-antitoxin module
MRYILFAYLIFLYSCDSTVNTYHPNGNVETAYHVDKDSLKHGPFIRYFENGQIAEESHFIHGKQDGQRVLYYPNGQKESEGTYVDGELHGEKRVYYDSGELMISSNYEHSEVVGIFKKYYKNGNLLEEVTFENDLENGPFKEYYEDGTIKWKGQYLNGDNEFGIIEHYNEAGELIKKLECDSMKICKTIWEVTTKEEE